MHVMLQPCALRSVVLSALLTAFAAASCRTNAGDNTEFPVSKADGPTWTGATRVDLIQAEPCPSVPDEHRQSGCKTLQTVLADLDHDGARDCVVWTRCGPEEPTSLPDGGFGYPRDTVTASRAGHGTYWTLYTNRLTTEAEQFEELSVVRFGAGDERVLARAVGYGSGNIHVWSIIDIMDGVARHWTAPPLQEAFSPLLGSDERIGKQYARAVEVTGGLFELSWLVYRSNDANCCPSGGLIKARLVPTSAGLEPERVWREQSP
jgi:hypothetical protein